jgi:putative ABC transport system permease protein
VGLLTAARYLARTPAFYNAPLILLVFTLSLSTYTASIAQTLDRHLTKQTYYATGADISLSDFGNTYNADDNLSPAYTFAPIEDYARLNGVRAVTRVGRYEASVARADSTQQDAQFLGIDRDISASAHWQPDSPFRRVDECAGAIS